ncbi:MAG: helix-turn-helix domain-containing protein [Ruminococcaceae bacterium]|nr:helix-turn-helix domain-containing protein [Oscillospiraceae bacterium]
MKYYFRDRLSDGSLLKLAHNIVDLSYISDHHDYHPHFEIYYSHKHQQQNVTINSQMVQVYTPHVTISAPFTIHDMAPTEQNLYFECYVLFFSENLIRSTAEQLLPSSFFRDYTNCIFPLTDEQNEYLYSILELIKNEDASESEKKAAFLTFVNALFRMVPKEKRIHTGKSNYYITEVLNFIYQNIDSINTAADILNVFHVSFSKLNRDFKQNLGLSVHQVIVNCRISKAIDLLTNTELKIKEIATQCGFENEYYFYVFFKNQTGKTPSTFRSQP